MYKLSEVKIICQVIYGCDIPERTWVRWREKVKIDKYARYCTTSEMELLATLSNLRRKTPLSTITFQDVIKAKVKVMDEFKQAPHKQYLIPGTCKGSKLPEIIYAVSGKTTSVKSLYRWGKEFGFRYSININYTRKEIEKWISIANKF